MTITEKFLTAGIFGFGILSIILIAILANVQQENDKYRAIIDISCKYSGSEKQCKNGIEMFMSMPIEELNKYKLEEYISY